MDRKRKTWLKYLVRHITADVYLGKWHRIKSFVRWVEPGLNLDTAARVLDLGTGDGILAFYLARKYPALHITGVDLDAEQIAANQSVALRTGRGKRMQFRAMDILSPNPDLAFDFIFAFDILEHIPDDAAALAHCAAMLAPGGRFIASVPSRLSLNERGRLVPSPGPPDHVRTGYDLDALSALVRAAGLRPVFHRYYYSPVMIRAWRVFTALDRISRPLTLIALPFYHYCFLREPEQNPESGNAFFLVAEKP